MATPGTSEIRRVRRCSRQHQNTPSIDSRPLRRAYRFRLEPTSDQDERLRQFAGARRFIWNWALQQRREYHRQTGKSLPARELSARLTALKDQPETAWLREIDSQLLQQVSAD